MTCGIIVVADNVLSEQNKWLNFKLQVQILSAAIGIIIDRYVLVVTFMSIQVLVVST